MALFCPKIIRINLDFKLKFIHKLKGVFNKQDFLKISDSLPYTLKLLDNIKNSNFANVIHYSQIVELEDLLFDKINEKLNARDNFGSDSVINALKSINNTLFIYLFFVVFSEYYSQNPDGKNKRIILKILNIMNTNTEMFKQADLQEAIKILSHPKFYDLKSEVGVGLNFFKKSPKSKIIQTMSMQHDKEKFDMNIDVENNLIVFTDKLNEKRHITFVELTHEGLKSLNLYHSLLKNMDPSTILIEQEPYQKNKYEISNTISNDIIKHDNFGSLPLFKDFMKNHNTDMSFQKDHVINRKTKQYCEVESIIYQALSDKGNFIHQNNKKNVILFDVPFHNFVQSFSHFLDEKSYQDYKDNFTLINLSEIINWLSLQESLGCKSCASFLNKNETLHKPLSLEFSVDKRFLPNHQFVLNYKINKIIKHVFVENKGSIINKQGAIIFASNIKELAQAFKEKIYHSDVDDADACIKENEFEFDDYITNNNFNPKNLSLSLLVKDNYQKYYTEPPLKLKNISKENFELFQNQFINDYSDLFGVQSYDIERIKNTILKHPFLDDEETDVNASPMKTKSFSSKYKTSSDKPSKCEPAEFLNGLISTVEDKFNNINDLH